jgi:hypothetical protein
LAGQGSSGQTIAEALVERNGVEDESGLRALEARGQPEEQLGQRSAIFTDLLRRLYDPVVVLGQIGTDPDRPPQKAIAQ